MLSLGLKALSLIWKVLGNTIALPSRNVRVPISWRRGSPSLAPYMSEADGGSRISASARPDSSGLMRVRKDSVGGFAASRFDVE